jgi:20S proteasome alpha/beta subunit
MVILLLIQGSTDKLPYVTMGSGSLAAMAIFENGWKKDMNKQGKVYNAYHQDIYQYEIFCNY